MAKKKEESEVVNEVAIVAHEDSIVPQEKFNELEQIESSIDLARLELEKTRREIEELKQSKEQYKFVQPTREVSEDEKAIAQKHYEIGNSKNALKSKIEAQKEYDDTLVTGRFINRHRPGRAEKLTYHKYSTDPVKWYPFEDGKVYTIKRGFADQINEYYHTPRFIEKTPGSFDIVEQNIGENSAIHHVDRSDKKYAFVPVGF